LSFPDAEPAISGGKKYTPPVFDNKGIIQSHKTLQMFNLSARLARHYNQGDSRLSDTLKRRECAIEGIIIMVEQAAVQIGKNNYFYQFIASVIALLLRE
jgi:hypothetical protein